MSVDLSTGELRTIAVDVSMLECVVAAGDDIAGIAAFDTAPPAICRYAVTGQRAETHIVRESAKTPLDVEDISVAQIHAFEGAGGRTIYGLYYPPVNAVCEGVEGTHPPVILSAHGGPTGMADRGMKLKIQYWTSRGFGFFDVDYTGSFGYGRAYRERLNGKWGIHDVSDMIAAARFLANSGLADAEKMVISGGSAGGYTVLMVLVQSNLFAGGASYYGISDMVKLLHTTHKFEGGYIYALTGTTAENAETVLQERSPVHMAHMISAPVIFFQGLEDKVVPPDQAERMVNALAARHIPVVYQTFANEGHGFRRAESVETALSSEYAFYARILGITVSESLPELNLASDS